MAGFHEDKVSISRRMFGKAGILNDGKSDRASRSAGTSPLCPQCKSAKVWKDGMRSTRLGPVQRWICRNCGYRFSGSVQPIYKGARDSAESNSSDEPEHVERVLTKPLKSSPAILSYRQICASKTKGAINLARVETRKERAAGATKPDQATVKGLMAQYMAYLEKEGYSEGISYPTYLKRLARVGANLLDPENVKEYIAKQPWKDSVKMLAVYAYDIMATKILKISWTPPRYRQQDTLPFVPDEKELDQLISACRSRRMAAFLQTLKETYADPGEILRLRWIDISANVIAINFPVKGHNAGQMKVSGRLITMLNALPKTSERIFPATYSNMRKCFGRVRKRVARNLENPRILAISFRTFRHWGGSMIAHYTNGNVLTVKKMLRHKDIRNSMKYIHMIPIKDDEFDVATATTVEEIKQLAGAGFKKFDEINRIHIFRRPKRFNA